VIVARRFFAQRRSDWPVFIILVLAGVLALRNLVAVVQFALHRALQGDFALYYVFARIGLHHGFGSLYDLSVQRQEWHAFGPTLFYPYIYPPPLAWLVAPFAMLPFPVGLGLWSALLAVALLVTWWLCLPGSRWSVRGAHLAVALAAAPVAFGLVLGQVVFIVAAAVAIGWWWLRKDRPFSAGVVLALIVLKPQLGFLIPLALLAGGRRRAVAGWLAGSGGMLAVCILTLGIGGLATYARRLVEATNALDTFIVPVKLTLSGLLGQGILAHVAQVVVVVVTLVCCWRRRADGREFPIAAGLCASLLVTPFIHTQDLAMLFPAAWLSLRTPWSPFERALGLSGYSASLILATPLPLLLVLVGWVPINIGLRRVDRLETAA